MRRIGVTTSVTAECWALRDGLLLAFQLGIAQLVVELDARVVVDLLVSNNSSYKLYSPIVNDCKSLLTGLRKSVLIMFIRKGTGVQTS